MVSPQILSPDCTNNLGSIVHGWDSMSSGYKLTVTFPATEVNTEMKAVILGAAFLLVCNSKLILAYSLLLNSFQINFNLFIAKDQIIVMMI
jgi:hypothetical protein